MYVEGNPVNANDPTGHWSVFGGDYPKIGVPNTYRWGVNDAFGDVDTGGKSKGEREMDVEFDFDMHEKSVFGNQSGGWFGEDKPWCKTASYFLGLQPTAVVHDWFMTQKFDTWSKKKQEHWAASLAVASIFMNVIVGQALVLIGIGTGWRDKKNTMRHDIALWSSMVPAFFVGTSIAFVNFYLKEQWVATGGAFVTGGFSGMIDSVVGNKHKNNYISKKVDKIESIKWKKDTKKVLKKVKGWF
jgi:hypothetical protein